MALAAVAGLPAYLGVIHEWEIGSKVASSCCFAFSVVSFLLGMFEEPSRHPVSVRRPKTKILPVSGMDFIRVAP